MDRITSTYYPKVT